MRNLLCIILTITAITLSMWGGTARAQDISHVDIMSGAVNTSSGTPSRIVISFNGRAQKPDKVFTINDNTPRLVMDWSTCSFLMSSPNNKIPGQGNITSVRYARRGSGTRLVVDLKRKNIKASQSVSGQQLTLTFNDASPNTPAQSSEKTPAIVQRGAVPRYFAKTAVPYPVLKPIEEEGASPPVRTVRRPVIVIDPGHGGRDPGAIGQNGTKEKTITTAAAKELRRQLLATGRYDVIMTRKNDVYVKHEERIRIARAGGADLFISIHADSAGPSARGATVYTLADRAKSRSRRLTSTQNWIMDVDLTEQTDPVGDILVDLAQRSTKSNSTEFADILLGKLEGSTRLINNSHRRAGYFVLLAPDVPAVLLELGYLSHKEDETLLNSAAHRKKVLRSVTSAINVYFDAQSP